MGARKGSVGTPPDESMEIEVVDLPPVPPWPWVNYEMEEAPEVYKWLTSKPPRIGLYLMKYLKAGLDPGLGEPESGEIPDMYFGKAELIPDKDKLALMAVISFHLKEKER